MSILTIVFNNGTTTKHVEITERPKRLKHLKAICRRQFGHIAFESDYVLHYKDEKIPLHDNETSLMSYYSNKIPIEVHAFPRDVEEDDYLNILGDEWTCIGGSNISSNIIIKEDKEDEIPTNLPLKKEESSKSLN